MRRSLTLLLAASLVVLAACGDDDTTPTGSAPATTAPATTVPATSAATTALAPPTTAAPTTDATTTTIDPVAASTAYAERGPYPVGVATLPLPQGNLVEVWYPAVDGTTGTVSYDVRDFTPPAIEDLLTADVPATYSYGGARDAEAAAGSFPVVLFSHGFSGFRVYASFLTSQLASHGMIVVAPDHPSRDLTNVLAGTASGDRAASVDDLVHSLDMIVAEGRTTGGRFDGRVDPTRVAAIGHSAGGWTVLDATGADPRIDGYVSMSSGGPEDGMPYPATPSFFLAGAVDGVVPPADVTRPAFDAAPAPSTYWEIDATGHNGFDDLCTLGGGTGIIGVAEASGLGAFLDTQPQFRALGEDGCVPPSAPVEQAFPIIRHAVTAWLRWLFGEDPAPVGLDVPAEGAFELDVTVAQH